jgi:hypothetical protein
MVPVKKQKTTRLRRTMMMMLMMMRTRRKKMTLKTMMKETTRKRKVKGSNSRIEMLWRTKQSEEGRMAPMAGAPKKMRQS